MAFFCEAICEICCSLMKIKKGIALLIFNTPIQNHMKRSFIFLLWGSLCLLSCKKSDPSHPGSGIIKIQVSQLTAVTDLNISMACPCGKKILHVDRQYGNKTYENLPVKSGDEIIVSIGSSVVSDDAGNGKGHLDFIYHDQVLLTIDGSLNARSANIIIP